MNDAVVLTGCGWVTTRAVGTASEVLAAVRADRVAALSDGHHRVPADLLDAGPALPEDLAEELDVRLAARAVQLACADASLPIAALAGERTALVIGCAEAGQGGMIAFANEVRDQSARFVSPIHFPQTVGNYPAGAVGRAFHIRGVNLTLACGAAGGLEAVAEAARQIAEGAADLAIAGGLEVFTEPLAQALATEHPVLADGACMFVLQRADQVREGSRAGTARWGGLRRVPAGTFTPPPEAATVQSGCGLASASDVIKLFGWGAAASGAGALAAAWVEGRDGQRRQGCAVVPGEGAWWAVAEFDLLR